MANNRMYLVHQPSGVAIYLGKRMGFGWYSAPTEDALQKFYKVVEEEATGSQDDFALMMEDNQNAPNISNWDEWDEVEVLPESRLRRLKRKKKP